MSPDAVDLADFDSGSENKDEDGSDSEDGYSDADTTPENSDDEMPENYDYEPRRRRRCPKIPRIKDPYMNKVRRRIVGNDLRRLHAHRTLLIMEDDLNSRFCMTSDDELAGFDMDADIASSTKIMTLPPQAISAMFRMTGSHNNPNFHRYCRLYI
jgi:hypothetical protein